MNKRNMANKFEIELGYQIGQEFEYEVHCLDYGLRDSDKHFKIRSIHITITENEVKVKYGIYVDWGKNYKGETWWHQSLKYFSEDELSKLLERKPHKFERELKFNIGDEVVSGVNGQIPDQIETYKESGQFFGNIFPVTEIRISIEENDKVIVKVCTNNVSYDGFSRKVRKEETKYVSEVCGEQYCGLLSNFDIDKLLEIKCKEMSKKSWRKDYNKLYDDKTLEPIIEYGKYRNAYAGLFNYLGVEDKAKELFKKYCDERDNGTIKVKKTRKGKVDKEKINNILESLSDKEREELLKQLMK